MFGNQPLSLFFLLLMKNEILAKAAGQNTTRSHSMGYKCIFIGVLIGSMRNGNNVYVNSENLKRYSYKAT